MHYKDKIY